jgi:UPF0176 protein
MSEEFPYWALAYYWIGPIADPAQQVARHQEFFKDRDVKCRIYLSEQGINGQLSARQDLARQYMQWMLSDPLFEGLKFKVHGVREQIFPKTTVKVRRQLVAMDAEADLSQRGVSIDPAEWKRMLEEKDPQTLVIDVRNDYEWDVGHFEGAERPSCESFREFPAFAERLKERLDPKRARIMMYCTGGIRCEFYSALMKEQGFDEVYQLDGGVIEYGLKVGSDHWEGKLFVFDDRLVVPISSDEAPPITRCLYCDAWVDVYFNCANMDCNRLFICCQECLKEHRGCCCGTCQSGRVRPYREDGSCKPFRKYSIEEKQALSS